MTERVIAKMLTYSNGNKHDIAHFLKVFSYAQAIGKLEGLDEKQQQILELSAVVHDIACPLCREKYGNTNGKHQEEESEALLIPFLKEFELPTEIRDRIIWLVTHHHTYHPVDGIEHQILLEADFLVNADESNLKSEAIETFCKNVFKTESGIRFLKDIYKVD